ncbi:MAG TPA: carboxylating nicotinate-nucleotide diphosphorylase [Gemmatimonadaceae bacterium]|nr:carboxylating nicotinate-nucleotide diphosphorylase [Gemmatimonadaceae bacterium]
MTTRPTTPHRITPLNSDAIAPKDPLRFPLDKRRLTTIVRGALREDNAFDDITTIATVVSTRRARGTVVARGSGVIAGVPFALTAFAMLDPKVAIRVDVDDGGVVEPGTAVMFVSGHARALLSAERVALNFMQRLSGIATLTSKFVDAVRGTRARILDTRKTTPGWRLLEKYAVRAGGGMNHRLDLSDAILIKDNHIAALDGNIALAVKRVRKMAPAGARIEVECENREQVEAALAAGADVVLLDNMTPAQLRECVKLAKGRALTEASGGITLETVRAVAESGVDWISIGALTHSAPVLDLALDFETL